ncbi:GTP cyclohydrolase I FolE [uncultured Duncaniella sp.]|uniref:GTP cyclohydrolase I FolE n=1 Tax=uncultured Duncaniella sp. TaxID=2768039 RepID=UPI00262FAAC3|nr:GTP cyclohydrolase I FolE [uncultured Duncaniella sp.]
MDIATANLVEGLAEGTIALDEVLTAARSFQHNLNVRADAVRSLLASIPGEQVDREGLQETPMRVAKMYEEIFGGYSMYPKEILSKTFDVGDPEIDESMGYKNGIVAVKEIPFYSHCEHHMVPFVGHAWVAYIPEKRVVGLSKIARLVECFARRLQIQERMTAQIADAIDEYLDPQGVMVVVQAEHLCMAMRGVKKPGTITATSAVRGVFTDMDTRQECLSILGLKG